MHFNGWVFGEEVRGLMNSLTHRFGEPPGDVWIPIDSQGRSEHDEVGWRSGWSVVHPEENDESIEPVEQWLHIAWPTTFLREQLGPYALLSDRAIDTAAIGRHNVREIGGNLHAAVPRFFDTIGDHWSYLRGADRTCFVTTSGEECLQTTIQQMDLDASLEHGGPSLIVGPQGPVFYDVSFGSRGAEESLASRRAAAEGLMRLPGDTPVTGIDFHG